MNEFIERLGWVLLHSLWQFALVTCVTWSASRAMRRTSATARYAALAAALAVMVAVPLATWMWLPVPAVNDLQGIVDTEAIDSERVSIDMARRKAAADRLGKTQSSPEELTLIAGGDIPHTIAEPPATIVTEISGLDQAALSWSERLIDSLRPWLTWIVAAWCIGVVVCCLRPLLGLHTLWRLRRVGVLPVSDDLLATLSRVSERLGLRRAVRVLQSTLAQVPVVVGYVRPVILLPVSLMTSLPAEQLEAIMAHELAHVRRHDFVVNLLQTLVESLFFYHPAVWWLSHQVRVEREHCCDDLVVELLSNRIEYGRALLAIEELRGHSNVLALGAADGSLLSRIRRIVSLGADHAANERWPAVFIGLAIIGAMCVLSMTWSLAAKDDEKSEPPPAIAESAPKSNPERFVAELPNGARVEFVGLAPMEEEPTPWWKPNGAPLNEVPKHGKTALKPAVPTERRGLVRIYGATDRRDVIVNYAGVRMDFGRTEEPGAVLCDVRTFPIGKLKTGRVEVGLATEPMSPVRVLDASGAKVPIAADAPADHIAEDIEVEIVVGAKSSNPKTGDDARQRTWITFESPVPGNRQIELDLKLIDKDGIAHEKESMFGVDSDALRRKSTYCFNVLPGRVARFEYRMRLYRHWVTFDNVSLNLGEMTDVTVKIESPPKPKKYAAELPNGLRLELCGVLDGNVTTPTAWQPDGTKIDVPKAWPELLRTRGEDPSHGFVFRAKGLAKGQSLIWGKPGRWTTPLFGESVPEYVGISTSVADEDSLKIRVGITDVWGPWQRVEPSGEIKERAKVPDGHRSVYDRIKSTRVFGSDTGTLKTGFVLEGIVETDDQAEYEVVAVNPQGFRHKRRGVGIWNGSQIPYFEESIKQIDHFEFRLQPYRHWVTFENVSLHAGKPTDVKIKVESLPEPPPPGAKAAVRVMTPNVGPGDWPQWGGTIHRNHVAFGQTVPTNWDIKSGENVKWSVPLGSQTYSSPVVANGKVFIGTNNAHGYVKEHPAKEDVSCLLAFEEATGKFLWQASSEKLPAGRAEDWPLVGICSSAYCEGSRVW